MSDEARGIPVERFTSALFALLEETFEHPHGIFLDANTSLFETLQDVSARGASRPVAPGRPTIAAQVEHCTFYLDVLERYLRGERVENIDWKAIWSTTHAVDEAQWSAMTTRLRAAYERVSAHLHGLRDWDGPNEVAGALAIVVHTAYHLGQIRLTAKALAEDSRSA